MTTSVAADTSIWLLVAAEARELSGFQKRRRASNSSWALIASGPGSRLVNEALREKRQVDGIVSIGFCGALDPSLEVGDIVVSGEGVQSSRAFVRGQILSVDRVAIAVEEKRALRSQTGAIAVEMEAAAVQEKAREWGVPFRCIKVVSDTANEDMPLDFNQYRDATGRFREAASRLRLCAAHSPRFQRLCAWTGTAARLPKN